MNTKNLTLAACGLVVSFLLIGCASTSVKKDELAKVHKVAIVSLFADDMIPWTANKILMTQNAPKGKMENFDPQTKQRVATEAYKAFSAEFRRLGWTALPLEHVTANAVYRKTFGPQEVNANSGFLAKAANYIGTNNNLHFFTAPGLFPIDWTQDRPANSNSYTLDLNSFSMEKEKNFSVKLADVTKALGVDAVALIYMDYCYTDAFSIVGPGQARMTAGSTLRLVNREGVMLVDMKPLKDRCAGPRGESQKTVPMFNNSITLGRYLAADTLLAAFIEATHGTAKVTIDQIHAAMTE